MICPNSFIKKFELSEYKGVLYKRPSYNSLDATSLSLLPLESKSLPPAAPPNLYGDRAFFNVCSKPRNFTMLKFTEG
uniref:NADP-specific glutamate dehydrogenase n=1 Tax=Rhizophora mucronata TaxID=61149 RepID=A0A2P2MTU3_RHIMU